MDALVKKLGGWSGVAIILTAVVGIGFIMILAAKKPTEKPLDTVLSQVAKDTGVDEAQLKKDMATDVIKKLVEDQKNDLTERLKALGETPSTPSIFLNSVRVNLTTLDDYTKQVDAAVAKAKTDNKLPVTLEVFSDYNCPHCAELEPLTVALKVKYKSDEVNFQEKNFPFLRDSSTTYAYAAEAARLQGKFDSFSQQLFIAIHGTQSTASQ